MVDVYEKLEAALLKEFAEVDGNPVINDVLNYTLQNDDEESDYALWAKGSEQFVRDNFDMLQEWDRMARYNVNSAFEFRRRRNHV
jgi:hypothetical protein